MVMLVTDTGIDHRFCRFTPSRSRWVMSPLGSFVNSLSIKTFALSVQTKRKHRSCPRVHGRLLNDVG